MPFWQTNLVVRTARNKVLSDNLTKFNNFVAYAISISKICFNFICIINSKAQSL